MSFEILEGQHLHPDFEDPDLLVKFSGPDVDLLLANKAELLLALEFLTMEALRDAGRASLAAVLRFERLSHAADRGAAAERDDRRGEA